MTLRVFNIDCMFVRHDVKLSIFILFFYFWMGFPSVGFLPILLNVSMFVDIIIIGSFLFIFQFSDDICLTLYAGDSGDICQENR